MRKEIESCDCPQGIQMVHSLSGGTGSLLLIEIRDNHPERITATFLEYRSPKVSNIVKQYNSTLNIHQLLENSDETSVIDNKTLYNILQNMFKLQQPKTQN